MVRRMRRTCAEVDLTMAREHVLPFDAAFFMKP